MTQEQATELKNDLNQSLLDSGNMDLTYSVYTVWNALAQKEYNVILYPLEYKTKYESANTSGQFAVVRVSLASQLKGAQSEAEFITTFQTAVSKDPEANDLLNK